MQDKNGNIYETTLNIAKAYDGRKILYSLSNTKKIDVGEVSSTRKMQEGLAHSHLSSDNSISNSEENVKYSAKENSDEGKITADMSDEERAEILKNTSIKLAEYTGNSEDLSEKKITQLQNTYRKQAGKTLRELGDKFGAFKDYSNENVELDFNYSHNSLNESVHKQGNISNDYSDFAKMLYIFDDVVNNAVPIAVNTDKYTGTKKENQNLKYDYVLLSAFEDGNNIVPVEFHIKEFNENYSKENKLYVSITLGKIKSEGTVLAQSTDQMNGQQSSTRVSSDEISIPDLLKEVNPEYGNFYKYIPSELLSDKQNASKGVAVKDEDYRLKVLRGEDVSDMLKAKAAENGYSADGEDNSKTLDVTYDDYGKVAYDVTKIEEVSSTGSRQSGEDTHINYETSSTDNISDSGENVKYSAKENADTSVPATAGKADRYKAVL
ncbi:MAG: hypothetical protein LIO53_01890 [Oscillospiraceae bacterium]|nr:hypothetical protein [Oscillospiraceae bacterium]